MYDRALIILKSDISSIAWSTSTPVDWRRISAAGQRQRDSRGTDEGRSQMRRYLRFHRLMRIWGLQCKVDLEAAAGKCSSGPIILEAADTLNNMRQTVYTFGN